MLRLLLVLNAVCLFFGWSHAQLLPNGDMENWTESEPDGWISPAIFIGNFADPVDFSEIPGNGGNAIHIWNALGTRSSVPFDLDGYPAYTSNPTHFSFDYRLSLNAGEIFYGTAVLYDASYQIVATANINLNNTANSSTWAHYTAPFEYTALTTPVALVTVNLGLISGSNLAASTYVDLDNLSGSNGANLVNESNTENDLKVYPSLANSFCTVDAGSINMETLEVYDAHGRLCSSHNNLACRSMRLDTSDLSQGMYIIKVKTQGEVLMSRIQVVK